MTSRTADLFESSSLPPRTGGASIGNPAARQFLASGFQKRLWFLEHLRNCGSAFHSCLELRLSGPLNRLALDQALGEIVRRHEFLRTTFAEIADGLVAKVGNHDPFLLPVDDLAAIGRYEGEAHCQGLSAGFFAEAFNLTDGPLFRARLVRFGADEHMLLLCAHEIIVSRAAWRTVVQELGILYSAYVLGGKSPLPGPPAQSGHLEPGDTHALEAKDTVAYWTRQFAGAPGLLEMPTDHPRPAFQSFQGARYRTQIPARLADQVRRLAREEGASLFVVLLAGWQALLAKTSGSEDIIIGTPVTPCSAPDVGGVTGSRSGTSVLRSDLSGDPPFREIIGRVRQVVHEASNRQISFEALLALLRPERTLSHSPLFQLAFELNDARDYQIGMLGLEVSVAPAHAGAARYDLEMELGSHGDDNGIAINLTYSAGLFEHDTISRMVEHYIVLLEGAVRNCAARLSLLPVVAAGERDRTLKAWNYSAQGYPRRLALHHWFERKAARIPGATAIVSGAEHLTYGELNRRANKLAWHLSECGVTSQHLVGICLERSLDMVVAVLAVLKSGAAYVPLDPGYPKERLAHIAEDSKISLIVSRSSLGSALSDYAGGIVFLDTDSGAVASRPPENPPFHVNACQRAYVLYTSGSTGKPKGVQITHRNLVSFLASMQTVPRIHGKDRLLAVTTLSFDIAGLELFLPLLSGATVVLASRAEAADGGKLRDLLARHGITMLQATPATWSLLMEARWDGTPRLKALCGGEALPAGLARQLRERTVGLWNVYGPTEATIWSTVCAVDADPADSIPIGRPLANTRTYVLDSNQQPVAIGIAGELHIGGDGVAQGYLNRPTLTAEKFLPDPFVKHGRMYRTGDRVRWRADGKLEFLGRFDQQVKLRGFRIELGEIENRLLSHPKVREAAVTVREDAPGGKRLAAYLVGDVTAEVLRDHLKQSLPEHMLPSAFVFLPSLPLTPNGKLDRKALPAPMYGEPHERAERAANLWEHQLTLIWEELLGVQNISPVADFFELGGHSLLAMRLFADIKSRFGCELPLSTLFQGATIRHLASAVQERHRSPSSTKPSPIVPLQPGGNLPPLFCIHPAGRDVYPYVRLAHHMGANQPIYGVRDQGDELGRPIVQIAREHVEALRVVQPEGPYFLLGYSFGVIIAYEMAVYLESQNQTVAFLGVLDMVEPGRCTDESVIDDAAVLAGLSFGHVTPGELAGMDLDSRLRYVIQTLRARNAAPRGFDLGELRSQFDLVRARQKCVTGYTPGSFSGRVTLFRAGEMREVDKGFLSWMADWTEEEKRTYSWCRRVPGRIDVHVVPGTHMSMLREPHVSDLAQLMRQSLAAAVRVPALRGVDPVTSPSKSWE